MIERNDDSYEIWCDTCPEAAEVVDTEDWTEMLASLVRAGWTYRYVDGEWEHYCPDCSEDAEQG